MKDSRVRKTKRGTNLIERVLMAGFLVVGAASIMSGVVGSIAPAVGHIVSTIAAKWPGSLHAHL